MACHQAVGPSQGLPLMEMNCCGLPRFPGLYGAHASRYSLMMIRTVLYRLSIIWSSFKGGDWLLIIQNWIFVQTFTANKQSHLCTVKWPSSKDPHTVHNTVQFSWFYILNVSAQYSLNLYCNFLKISDCSRNNQEKKLSFFSYIIFLLSNFMKTNCAVYCTFK